MKHQSRSSRAGSIAGALGALFALALAAASCRGEDVGATHQPLTAACVDSTAPAPTGAWMCGQNEIVECDTHQGAYVDFIYTTVADGQACGATRLVVNEPGPFLTGTHTIVVSGSTNGGPVQELCSSTLTVIDTAAPFVSPKEVTLWPPNHKYNHVTPADCVTVIDACDPGARVWFTSASSDEPAGDPTGADVADDIANLGCDGVDLRSDRLGTSDGRVYTLGFHAEDAAGHGVDGACRVVVPHDMSGRLAVDNGVNHRIDLAPGSCPAKL